jgi:hypothetical protein
MMLTGVTRTAVSVAGATVIAAAMLGACRSTSASWSCAKQAEIAEHLASSELFTKMSVEASEVVEYSNYPCKEGSGGSVVTAGRRYAVIEPLTPESLRALGAAATASGDWRMIAELAPGAPGSGGDAHLCYQDIGVDTPTYLVFHAVGTPTSGPPGDDPRTTSPSLYIELSKAKQAVEICPVVS